MRLQITVFSCAILGVLFVASFNGAAAQSVHEAPANAPSAGRVAPAGEPGKP